MVREYKLKQAGKEVRIEGESYFIDVADPLVINALMDVAKKYSNMEKSIDKDNAGEQVRKVLEDLTNTIDIALGKGSAAKIFKEKKADFVNVVGILEFITEEAFESIGDIKNKYSKKK